jgi:GMP synthase (glutamine-hydrolysing)
VHIGRLIRELGVYSELIPGDTPLSDEVLGLCPGKNGKADTVRCIILSGSPESVYTKEGPIPDQRVYTCGLPLLGICYGLQRLNYDNGGMVEAMGREEHGEIEVRGRFPLPDDGFADFEKVKNFFTAFDASVSLETIQKSGGTLPTGEWAIKSWMSHGDTLTMLAPGFRQYAVSAGGCPSVLVHESKPFFGLLFHPEAAGCERSLEIFAAFIFGVSRCSPEWTMEHYVNEACSSIAEKVGKNPVLLLISGGVDSTVVGALLLKTLASDQVHLMYMNTGLMRKDETTSVTASLERLGAKHLHIVQCEDEFLTALKGIEDPETKRKVIGDTFITIQERETARLDLSNAFLAQGTIYPDLKESGQGTGKKTQVIKSHHNVGTPLVDAKRKAGRLVEPLDKLFKEEVRVLGRLLGVDESIISRHPFPGPGIAVRILGEVTKEKCEILRKADAIYMEELKKRKGPSGHSLYDEIWQAFPVLLPVRSTGVAGNIRKYGWVLTLRAITSADAMTADVYPFQIKDLLEISTRITDTVKEIGRVTYDISNKPPATIEWE